MPVYLLSLFRFAPPGFLLFLYIVLAACHNTPQPASATGGNTATTAYHQQLDTIRRTGEDSIIAPQVRALYSHTAPALHNAVFPATIKTLGTILLFHTSADAGILPFYRGLYAEPALNDKNRATAGIKLANYFAHIAHNPDSAGFYLQYATKHPEALDDTLSLRMNDITAQQCQLRGQMKEAVSSLYREITLAEKLHDSISVSGAYINLANVYRGMGDFSKAMELRKKGLAYFQQRGDETSAATAIGGLAADFLNAEQVDSARMYFLEAEILFKKGIQSPVAEYYLYISKAGMYIKLKKYDSSVLYFDKAKAMLPLFNNPSQEQEFNITSAIAYTHLRNMKQEASVIQSYIPQMLADSNYHDAANAYYSLYNIALTQTGSNSALDYYLSYDSVRTILTDLKNRDFAAEMESKYESQQKSLKILTQEKELGQKRALNWILMLSVLGTVLLASALVARLQLQRSRREARLQQQFTRGLLKNTEEERGRIAVELHDGISHELLLLKNKLHQDVTVAEEQINSIINDIRMLSRNLHPAMLDKIGLKLSIEHLCEQLVNGGKLFVSAGIDYSKQLPPDDELQLYRLIQESLNNVIKYADAHAAKVTIHPEDGQLLVTVMDNGKGFDVTGQLQSGHAFGLHSMIERGRALGGKTTINSSLQGTTIHLEIPLNNGNSNHSR